MLKKLLFAASFWLLPAAARAAPTPLVVGTVRDAAGSAIPGATVRVTDAGGATLGSDTTDRFGTFAVAVAARPAAVIVACRHCRTTRLATDGSAAANVVVDRWRALETTLPDARDLAALPYARISDALGLVPFAVVSSDGTQVSDRGLAHGRGLVLDDGAPVYGGGASSGLVDFPGRYVQRIDTVAPSRAFEYGSGAGGGLFALDQVDPDRLSLAADGGPDNGVALEPVVDAFFPSSGVSSDGTELQRRADADVVTPFAGGLLRLGAGSASDAPASGAASGQARSFDEVRLAYATASRRYVTSAGFDANDSLTNGPSAAQGDAAYGDVTASFRLERPGPVALAAGARLTSDSDWYRLSPHLSASQRRQSENVYVEASAASARGTVLAGLGLSHDDVTDALPTGTSGGNRLTLLPSVRGELALGGGFAALAGLSTSLRVPNELEAYQQLVRPGTLALERGALQEAGFAYDAGGRIRVEATAYREDLTGDAPQRLVGLGASLVWQVAPRIALRAWTLRDSASTFAPVPYALQGDAPFSRAVVWATYDLGDDGVRVDAIAHRDVGTARATALDGDVVVPVVRRIAVSLGTSQRAGARRYGVGIRVR